mgnify:CR=1 FL=1|jgi:hypothetical protein
MKRNYPRIAATLITLMVLALLAIGCSKEHEDAKSKLQEALAKQQQITSHTYEGRLSLNLGKLPIDAANQPYTSVIVDALRQGEIRWSGASDTTQNRREATLEFQSSEGSSAFVIPVVQNADSLYIHVPLINTEDEFFEIPTPAFTGKFGGLTLDSLAKLLDVMDAKWFELTKDESAGDTYQVRIDEGRWQTFTDHLQQALPDLLSQWQAAGVITKTQAAAIQETLSTTEDNPLQVHLPEGRDAYIRATLQDNGYLSAVEISLSLAVESSIGHEETYDIQFRHTWDHINEQVTFTRTIPESTVSWEEIMKLIP